MIFNLIHILLLILLVIVLFRLRLIFMTIIKNIFIVILNKLIKFFKIIANHILCRKYLYDEI